MESKERAADVARMLNLPATTVRTIFKTSQAIKKRAALASSLTSVYLTRLQSSVMVKMERLLSLWIDDLNKKKIPVSQQLIQEKALSLYDDLKAAEGEDAPTRKREFVASRGWFDRFKRRFNLHYLKLSGEVATADEAAAAACFREELKKIVDEGGYSAKQIFNVDETCLFWKRMPSKTFITRDELKTPGFKASKDMVTLLFASNTEGDFKLKPLLVYHSENPRALRGYLKSHLKVIWKSNRKAWITRIIFREWFVDYAVPAWRTYCQNKNLEFKILLILDNTLSHKLDFDTLCPNVRVVFIPPRTASILQPMDQGIIMTFKAYYLRRLFSKLIRETAGEGRPSITEAWYRFNILNATDIMGLSWDELTSECTNGAWRNVLPHFVHHYKGLDPFAAVKKQVVALAKELGLEDIDEKDIDELLEPHSENLTNEDLISLEDQCPSEEDEDDDDAVDASEIEKEDPEEETLTIKTLYEAFEHINKASEIFSNCDPFRERSDKVARALQDSIACYKEIYMMKSRAAMDTALDFYFKSEPSTPSSDQPSTSSGHF